MRKFKNVFFLSKKRHFMNTNCDSYLGYFWFLLSSPKVTPFQEPPADTSIPDANPPIDMGVTSSDSEVSQPNSWPQKYTNKVMGIFITKTY